MSTKAICPVCKRDCRNPTNLASHLKAKHPHYLKPDKAQPKKSRAEQQREWVARATRESSATLRDIAPLPPIADPERRRRCAASLLEHCRTYYPAKFYLPFSPTHLKVIAKLERAVLRGGVFAVAMPRGSGKSELAKRACEWAVLNGYRRFVVLLGATQELAEGLLADIMAQLEGNDLLLADYPEACYPVKRLEGIVQRAKGQTYEGTPTKIEWGSSQIRLANLPGSACAWSVIRAEGLTGAVRGMSVPGADGETWRPDLVIPDDPQTRESACSPTQVKTRLSIITGDVLGLAGPSRQVACLLPCTVISKDDLADQLLDRQRNPQWQGERSKLVESFPTAEQRWEEYFKIRDEDYRADGDGRVATDYYLAHREEMDAGCVLSWPERFDSEAFASAVEEAMCAKRYKPQAFAAEMQNEPLQDADVAAGSLSADGLAAKTNNRPRGEVPPETVHLTAGIDVQKSCLFYAVTAWVEGFGGHLVDYGVWPRQNRAYFTARDARPSLADQYPGFDESARVVAGIQSLADHILSKGYARHGGGESTIERCMIDCGWNQDIVMQAARQSKHSAILLPSKGYGIGASAAPIREWKLKPGGDRGTGWIMSPRTSGGRGRQYAYDSNYFKSFVSNRLLTPNGGRGCLYLPGGDNGHLIDHLTSEYRVTVTSERQGRKVDEWKKKLNRENHWFDTLVLSAVAAATLKLAYDAVAVANGTPTTPPQDKPKKRVDLAAAARQRGFGVAPAGAFGGY